MVGGWGVGGEGVGYWQYKVVLKGVQGLDGYVSAHGFERGGKETIMLEFIRWVNLRGGTGSFGKSGYQGENSCFR